MGCVVAAAAPELEHRPQRWLARGLERASEEAGLFFVVRGRRQQRPPFGELVVHPGHVDGEGRGRSDSFIEAKAMARPQPEDMAAGEEDPDPDRYADRSGSTRDGT